jgi:hypothetical protein
MAFSPEDELLLAGFKAAYAKLISGEKVAETRSADGRLMRYHQGDTVRLEEAIEKLEAAKSSNGSGRRGALRFTIS